jgi:hypothetical protein
VASVAGSGQGRREWAGAIGPVGGGLMGSGQRAPRAGGCAGAGHRPRRRLHGVG